MKNAALHCKDVSAPFAEMKSKKDHSAKCIVTRQSRLSMEFHPDVLTEAMFSDVNYLKNLVYSDDGHDDLYDFLLRLDETAR